jgi:hypothetical protein
MNKKTPSQELDWGLWIDTKIAGGALWKSKKIKHPERLLRAITSMLLGNCIL